MNKSGKQTQSIFSSECLLRMVVLHVRAVLSVCAASKVNMFTLFATCFL